VLLLLLLLLLLAAPNLATSAASEATLGLGDF
jgi:hypothetical protein